LNKQLTSSSHLGRQKSAIMEIAFQGNLLAFHDVPFMSFLEDYGP
jgi:hypothetical protein